MTMSTNANDAAPHKRVSRHWKVVGALNISWAWTGHTKIFTRILRILDDVAHVALSRTRRIDTMSLPKTTEDHSSVIRLPGAAKVPAITAVFWLLKLLTTAMGESASDFLLHASPVVGL